jgi:hypothetical protein
LRSLNIAVGKLLPEAMRKAGEFFVDAARIPLLVVFTAGARRYIRGSESTVARLEPHA